MKYRIAQTGEGFKIQRRFLFLWWITCAEPDFFHSDYHDGFIYSGNVWRIFRTKEDAEEHIRKIKGFPIEYRGHTIYYCGRYYIDRSSLCCDKGSFCYRNGDKSLEYLKVIIDREEDGKIEDRNARKIIKTYDVD